MNVDNDIIDVEFVVDEKQQSTQDQVFVNQPNTHKTNSAWNFKNNKKILFVRPNFLTMLIFSPIIIIFSIFFLISFLFLSLLFLPKIIKFLQVKKNIFNSISKQK